MTGTSDKEAIPRTIAHSKKRMWILDVALLGVGLVAVSFVLGLLTFSVLWQQDSYRSGRALVEAGTSFDAPALLAFARAHDFAIVRTNGLFLGFLLVFMGCLYVLRINEARFSLQVESDQLGKGQFESSSPGLVLATLGVILVIVVVIGGKSQITYLPADSITETPATPLGAPNVTPIE